jgi:hypothetical protein
MMNTFTRARRVLAAATLGLAALATSVVLATPAPAAQGMDDLHERSGQRICLLWDYAYRECLQWIEAPL